MEGNMASIAKNTKHGKGWYRTYEDTDGWYYTGGTKDVDFGECGPYETEKKAALAAKADLR
jgi:hypothetical protein